MAYFQKSQKNIQIMGTFRFLRIQNGNLIVLTIVNRINNSGCQKCAQILARKINGKLFPFKLFTDGQGQSDGRIQMAPGNTAGNVGSQHDSDAKAPIDGEKVAILLLTQFGLGY